MNVEKLKEELIELLYEFKELNAEIQEKLIEKETAYQREECCEVVVCII